MKKICSLEEYKSIIRGVDKRRKTHFTNNYDSLDSIRRFIGLERLYCHLADGGIVFLYDEESYFRACLYLDGERPFTIPATERKVLVRNVFREGKKESVLPKVENRLQEIGFEKADTAVQIYLKAGEFLKRIQVAERYAKRLERAGFRFVTAAQEQIPQIDQLLIDSDIIKDYHISFRTQEEKIRSGNYMAAMDPQGKLCGGSVIYVENGISQGVGVAIKEEYKLYGIAPVLGYYKTKWILESGIDLMQGWIVTDNKASIEYNKSLGALFTDKYADEWVRQP